MPIFPSNLYLAAGRMTPTLVLPALVLFSCTPTLGQDRIRAEVPVTVVSWSPGAAEDTLESLARLSWEIATTVQQHHLSPPLRSQMILEGIRSFDEDAARELRSDIEHVTSQDDLESLLRRLVSLRNSRGRQAVDPGKLIDGMLKSAPGNSQLVWVSERQARIDQQLAENRYVGIGIALSLPEGEKWSTITTAFRGGPAHRGGIRSGDQILQVDGVSMSDMNLRQIVEALRGAQGSDVSVVVRQPDQPERQVEMTRDVVPIASVKGFSEKGDVEWEFALPDHPDLAYIELLDITGSSAAELTSALRQIRTGNFTGLVLDLRNCFGGQLHHIRMVADVLVAGEELGSWTDNTGKTTTIKLRKTAMLADLPICIIVSPRQTNGIQMLAEALVKQRNCRVVGRLSRNPIHVFRNVQLESGKGTLKGILVGKAKTSGDPSLLPPAPTSDRRNSRFLTKPRTVDRQIREAAAAASSKG